MKKLNQELVPLNAAEAKIYFSSDWYRTQMKAKRLKLIELKIIKQKKVLH
jgi:hypothetical protein